MSGAPVPPQSELDRGLNIAGLGWYNIRMCMTLSLALIASIVELIGYSIVLPAARCDLGMSDKQRGIVHSIPYVGVVLTSYVHGYMADTQGRKKILVYNCLISGCLSFLSAFMPEIISFSICKFLTSLCIACPSAVPYTYIGEIVPAKHRDLLLSLVNAGQISGTALVPLLAWAIIPLDFRIDFGLYEFRPWRLLTMAYSLFLIATAVLLTFGPESPKFLLSKGKADDALKVLQTIYAGNKKQPPGDFEIKSLPIPPNAQEHHGFVQSIKEHSLPLLKWNYLKYLLLNGFLLFGIFAILNGLFLWVPDVLNRVLTGSSHGKTACQVITDRFKNHTKETICDDTIDTITFKVNSVAQIICALLAFAISFAVKCIGKKKLLLVTYFVMGTVCVLLNFIKEDAVFAILMSTFPLMALSIASVNAYAVQIFPTHLRGMAICLSMMLGRLGSVSGNTVAGVLINIACETMFYMFGALLFICGSSHFCTEVNFKS